MKNILFTLFFFSIYFSCFSIENNVDSLFLKSFNLRYINPSKGILLAKTLINSNPQKAYLSLAYNYFFKSDYDSSDIYLDKIINSNKVDEIVLNLAQSCKGYIDQRIGNDFYAYKHFETAKEFYYKKKSKYIYNQLFLQGEVINQLGLVTLTYYYLRDFDKISNDLDGIITELKSTEGLVSNDLKFQVHYLYIQNYFKNSINSASIRELNEHFRNCIIYADTSSYYQAGNLFEIFGLYYKYRNIYHATSNRNLDSLLNTCNFNKAFCSILQGIIKNSDNPELEFLRTSLHYFNLHGDPYQIAGANTNIAEFFAKKISNVSESQNQIHLDSLNYFITQAMNIYQNRDSLFFKSIFEKQEFAFIINNIDSLTSKLISIPWYIETLKLKIFYYSIPSSNTTKKSKIKAIIFTTELLEALENDYKSKTQGFYKEMEKYNEAKSIMEQKQLRTVIIIFAIIILFIIVGISIFYHSRKKRRKEKEVDYIKIRQAKERLQEWNSILNALLDIKENVLSGKDPSFIDEMKFLNEKLGKYFNTEYCAIGIVNKNFLVDIANYFNKELTNYQKDLLNKLKLIPFEDTIIGRFLSSGEDFCEYYEADITSLEKGYLPNYYKLLESKKVSNIKLIGLYSSQENKKTSIGYIIFINVNMLDNDFTEKSIKLGQQISGIFISENNRKTYLNKINDENFTNGLLKNDFSIEKILDKTSTYFAKEFNAGVISFRVPVINGPDENPDENLLFPLRFLFVNDSIKTKHKIVTYYNGEKKILHLANIAHKKELLENFPDDIYFNEIGQDKSFYKQFELDEIFRSKINIVLPIRKTINQSNKELGLSTHWKNLYGIFNLQLFEIKDLERISERLKFLSINITYVINGIINKLKYQQMNSLHDEINLLDYSQSDTFNSQIAKLISKVINADICSIFMFNKTNDKLELKATTATRAVYNSKELDFNNFKYKDDVYYDLNEKNSVTVRVFLENKTYMIYSTDYYKNYSTKFIERMNTRNIGDYTRLLVPIRNKTGQSIGVIRCIGTKNSDENLIHSFWDFDLETIEFISALASRFIENSQFDKEKDNFVKQVVHESLSPISELSHMSEEYYNRVKRNNKITDDFSTYYNNIINTIFLQKQIMLDLSDVSLNKTKIKYLVKHEENIYKILLETVQMLEPSAHFDRGISIQTNMSDLPILNIDKNKIKQVFINLIQNAINYSFENSTVNIFYKTIEEHFENTSTNYWHEIKFANEGIGIPEKEKEDIFMLYRRGSNVHLVKPTGFGIGLFLVDQIMKAHQGLCIIRNIKDPTEISILFPKNK